VTNWPAAPRIVVVTFVVTAATCCSGTRNYEQAYFSPQRTGYLVELQGKRHRLAHDPISLIVGRSYDETHELVLPRLEGTIDGREIPHFKYNGSIVISEKKMNVALTYGDRAEVSSWNGTYRLSPKVEPSPREIAAVRATMLRGNTSESVIAARRLMDMGRAGRRTVYDELLNNPTVAARVADDVSTMYIGRREKVERWVPEDVSDLERLALSGDQEIMRVGMSFLSCTDEGKRTLREIARKDPSKQESVAWYLER
jgi:hypothetical protein